MMSILTRGGSFIALVTLCLAGFVPCHAASTCLTVLTNGYTFVDVNGPNAGNNAAAGTNLNGLSNGGVGVGFDIDNNGALHNFYGDVVGTITPLNINGSTTAMALGINSSDRVVGTDGNGNAFFLAGTALQTFIPGGGSAAIALGINDRGNIVGQYTIGGEMPGFFMGSHTSTTSTRIDAPSGPDTVFAQSVNVNGEIVGFYVGTDGQDHGFKANLSQALHNQLTGTAVADPSIPVVKGEPGATFVFSQILSVNKNGIAAGYYGDSTTSQHGFLYNLNTGHYAFLDNPSERFHNGVEVTQITGVTDAGEITGFYSDANGVFHGFFAWPAGSTCQ